MRFTIETRKSMNELWNNAPNCKARFRPPLLGASGGYARRWPLVPRLARRRSRPVRIPALCRGSQRGDACTRL